MALSNAQYQEIMRSYDQVRFRHVREREERIRMIYKNAPGIRSLEENIASLAAGKGRALLSGDGTALAELKTQLSVIREEKKRLLREAGYSADAMELQYDCKYCRDTGFVNGNKCRCFKQKEIALLYKQSNLQEILAGENFDTFTMEWFDEQGQDSGQSPRDNILRIKNICLQMVRDFPVHKQSLLLTGPTGTGKTFMSHCIAKALMDQCYSVVYLSAAALFDIFSGHQFQEERDADTELLYEHIHDCDLLIIDDLGTEFTNSFTLSKLFSCINERSRNGGAMVISTNLNLAQLHSRYSERISSRLISECRILEFIGDDIRIKKVLSKKNQRKKPDFET